VDQSRLISKAVWLGPSRKLLQDYNLYQHYAWRGAGVWSVPFELWRTAEAEIPWALLAVDTILPEYTWKRFKISAVSRQYWDWRLACWRLIKHSVQVRNLGASTNDASDSNAGGVRAYTAITRGTGESLRTLCVAFYRQNGRELLFFRFGWMHTLFTVFARSEAERAARRYIQLLQVGLERV